MAVKKVLLTDREDIPPIRDHAFARHLGLIRRVAHTLPPKSPFLDTPRPRHPISSFVILLN